MTLVWRPFRSAQAGSAALRFGLWVYSGFRVRVLS